MKNILLPMLIIVGLISCKKNSGTPATTIEYRISPMNSSFTKITYTDNSGNAVIVTDPSKFVNGAKSITITSKPFTAKIETLLNNTTTGIINYSLAISVDGQLQKLVQVSVPPVSSLTSAAEFSVQ